MDRNIHLSRTNPDHSDFRGLISLLDEFLSEYNGSEHAFFSPLNETGSIKNVIVAYIDGKAVGCGAIKPYEAQTAEVKRMFVHPDYRRNGIAGAILKHLEAWAAELNYTSCILETGDRLKEAITLYQHAGYQVIPNYGPYQQVEGSVCMQKNLTALSSAL